MLFVEFKGCNYSLREVKEQIECSISLAQKAFQAIRNAVIVPVCCAQMHPKENKRFIDSYKVKSPKGALTIKMLNFGDRIEKAIK